MRTQAEAKLREALEAYDFPYPLAGAVRYGHGHINDTFCVLTQPREGDCVRYILQRINGSVFPNPVGLMENMVAVTGFLREKVTSLGGDPSRETLQLFPTRQGASWYTDTQGEVWRLTDFVEGTYCLQSAGTPALFAASARAFGRFQRLLGDFPAETLHEVIPRFHDTENRFRLLLEAMRQDSMGRAPEVRREIDFVQARQADCSVAVEALRQGVLPLRVTHNDTKLNNVLLDRSTREGICVIDLDTVMPGLSIYDFGDSIRFGANHAAEDEKDLSLVNLDLDLYEAYTQGFLTGAGNVLTPEEIRYLPWGARLMTLECGIRFLTDYLQGDTYFKTQYPGQNLDRCRTQFKLVSQMEEHFSQMEDIALTWGAQRSSI